MNASANATSGVPETLPTVPETPTHVAETRPGVVETPGGVPEPAVRTRSTKRRASETHPRAPEVRDGRPGTSARGLLSGRLPARYLTPEDLAAMFSVPIETVYAWRRKRTGPPGFRIGKHIRYDPAAVHTWVTQQATTDAA